MLHALCFVAGEAGVVEFSIEASSMPPIKFMKGKREIKPSAKVPLLYV